MIDSNKYHSHLDQLKVIFNIKASGNTFLKKGGIFHLDNVRLKLTGWFGSFHSSAVFTKFCVFWLQFYSTLYWNIFQSPWKTANGTKNRVLWW